MATAIHPCLVSLFLYHPYIPSSRSKDFLKLVCILGNITISTPIILTVDSDLDGTSPQFTLTCISTGGPATTVTWTRDSVTVTEGTESVLTDPVTANYTHTLTGRLRGLYTCTVANNNLMIQQS